MAPGTSAPSGPDDGRRAALGDSPSDASRMAPCVMSSETGSDILRLLCESLPVCDPASEARLPAVLPTEALLVRAPVLSKPSWSTSDKQEPMLPPRSIFATWARRCSAATTAGLCALARSKHAAHGGNTTRSRTFSDSTGLYQQTCIHSDEGRQGACGRGAVFSATFRQQREA